MNDHDNVKEMVEHVPNVRWAPLKIPLERRLQTAAVLVWVFLLGNSVNLFIISLFFPFLYPLHIAYFIYCWFDQSPEKGGRRSDWFRQLSFWKYFAGYFPAKLIKEVDLDPSKNYIFGYHPHGIISMGAVANFGTEATGFSDLFPGIQASLLTLTSNFKIPFYREIILALGIASVSRQSCEYILNSGPGRSITIVIGGASESLNARPGVYELTLRKRLGFIRLAIKNKASIVPTFSFGENDLYQQVDNSRGSWLWKIQKQMQQAVGFTVPLFYARGIFNYDIGLIPYRHPIVTVVGSPIEVPELAEGQTEPTEEQLISTQELYIKELESIYNKYKDVYAKDRKHDLKIVN